MSVKKDPQDSAVVKHWSKTDEGRWSKVPYYMDSTAAIFAGPSLK